jgi:hypothetical protein
VSAAGGAMVMRAYKSLLEAIRPRPRAPRRSWPYHSADALEAENAELAAALCSIAASLYFGVILFVSLQVI